MHADSVARILRLPGKSVVGVTACLVDLGDMKDIGKGRGGGMRRVLSMNIADHTGVVLVSLWSPLCEEVDPRLQQAFEEASTFPKVVLSGVEVVVVSKAPLPLAKLQSRRSSTVKIFEDASPLTIMPSSEVVVGNFNNLGAVGEKVCLRGRVQREAVQTSQAGVPFRGAVLVDRAGVALPMILYDQNAKEELAEGQEICCFWAEAKAALVRDADDPKLDEEKSGQFWMFSDSYMRRMESKPTVLKIVRHVNVV